jgi:hypothetical protein
MAPADRLRAALSQQRRLVLSVREGMKIQRATMREQAVRMLALRSLVLSRAAG